MATRGYYGIKKKGELKGTYNHWDSYPKCLGLKLLTDIADIEKSDRVRVLSETFDYIDLINEDRKPTKEEIDECISKGVANLEIGERSKDSWYCLLRETQGSLRYYIKKIIPYMENGNSFLEDSVFCEWAYIINLDTCKFEIYENGNNKVGEMDLCDLSLEKLFELDRN